MSKFAIVFSILIFTFHCPLSKADTSRFTATGNLKFKLTGNALGLSGAINENGPGTRGSIHAFTSLNDQISDDTPANLSNPWPVNTTNNFLNNGSDAQLVIPPGASVVYAELIWGGSYRYFDDVEANLGNSVSFTTPTASTNVSPSAVTEVTLDFTAGSGAQVAYYLRSADVTALVSSGGSGTYQLEGVPATQHELINSSNAAGWALVIAISDTSFACRSVDLRMSGNWVDEETSLEFLFSGLSVKGTEPVNGRLLAGAVEGDANLDGDGVAIRNPLGISFISLSTANNPETNFFASQVNTSSGGLDTSGSWGLNNHNALTGTNIGGGRQGWDITGIPLQSAAGHLVPGQTQTSVRASSSGDEFVLAFLALEVDADSRNCFVEDDLFADGFEKN